MRIEPVQSALWYDCFDLFFDLRVYLGPQEIECRIATEPLQCAFWYVCLACVLTSAYTYIKITHYVGVIEIVREVENGNGSQSTLSMRMQISIEQI